MYTGTSTSQDGSSTWTTLYLAAIFEHDESLVAARIAEAEQAVVLRAHELFHASGDHIEEQSALDDAMYALHALRNSLKRRITHPQRGLRVGSLTTPSDFDFR
jgi:hypothetical protein